MSHHIFKVFSTVWVWEKFSASFETKKIFEVSFGSIIFPCHYTLALNSHFSAALNRAFVVSSSSNFFTLFCLSLINLMKHFFLLLLLQCHFFWVSVIVDFQEMKSLLFVSLATEKGWLNLTSLRLFNVECHLWELRMRQMLWQEQLCY